MDIRVAESKDKKAVLSLLDDFRTVVNKIYGEDDFVSTSARDLGGLIFDEMIESEDIVIILAVEEDTYIGILTAAKIPQLRKGRHYVEIEEFFVKPKYHGTGVAQQLMEYAVAWAKEAGVTTLRLESGVKLERAHNFYEKVGFEAYGKAFKKVIS